MVILLTLVSACEADAADFAKHALELRNTMVKKIMPYWHDTAQDQVHGGYLLSDDASKAAQPAISKQLVTQSRMIWGFSHAHLKGCSDGRRDYRKAAEQGYRFLIDHFLDREHGGYYWTTDRSGKVTNDRKIVYGESFVIYGLVEYYRASGDKAALDHAMDLYKVLQKRAYDAARGGWMEHFERDWKPLLPRDPHAEVEVSGYKSANTHLHLMEALTELYDVTRNADVKKSLEESVRINKEYFYPINAGKSCFHRQPDWSPVTDDRSAGLSYGHNVEFAWLMIRAETVLGCLPSWDHFEAHMQHALKYGTDRQYGGLYSRGNGDQPATDMRKVWWVEAEWLAALSDALRHRENADYVEALEKLLEFINKHQADPKDGIWLDTVTADGQPKVTARAHNWKANYHDVRGIIKFIEAFSPSVSGR